MKLSPKTSSVVALAVFPVAAVSLASLLSLLVPSEALAVGALLPPTSLDESAEGEQALQDSQSLNSDSLGTVVNPDEDSYDLGTGALIPTNPAAITDSLEDEPNVVDVIDPEEASGEVAGEELTKDDIITDDTPESVDAITEPDDAQIADSPSAKSTLEKSVKGEELRKDTPTLTETEARKACDQMMPKLRGDDLRRCMDRRMGRSPAP